MIVERKRYLSDIKRFFDVHPIVAILGPRQCGKTTLARMFSKNVAEVTHFDLEDPVDLARLDNPKLALESLEGLIIIDEIQRRPDLFGILRVLVDRPKNPAKFLILGSASRDLIRQGSESLAGRIGFLELSPFSLSEINKSKFKDLWIRGGFPKSLLAKDNQESKLWRKSYISTYLERDIPNLGISIPSDTLRRFWSMLTHYHGQVLNFSELGRSFGIADTTVKRYIDILTGTFMVRQLSPWFENNLGKRQVKSPKLYLRDSGIYHSFLGAFSIEDLHSNPKLGASWEGFALEEIVRLHNATAAEAYFWSSHAGAEIDLLIYQNGRKIGYEIKYTDAPKKTKSMSISLDSLKLDSLTVVYPGKKSYPLAENIYAVPLTEVIIKGG